MKLSSDQENAADMFCKFLFSTDENEMVIEGKSGSGKSTLTKHLIKLAQAQAKLLKLITDDKDELEVHCTATTNKAAKVLSELAGRGASTIHSFLGLRVFNDFKTGKTSLKKTKDYQVYKNTLIIIDEASMIDKQLLEFIRESTRTCKVLYIGDPYQLTAVKTTVCPVFTEIPLKASLTTIMRQSKGSTIATLGETFRETIDTGMFTDIMGSTEVIKVDGKGFQDRVDKAFTYDMKEGTNKIVAWTNDKVHAYNDYVRKLRTNEEAFEVGEAVVTNNPIMINGLVYYSTDTVAVITSINHDAELWDIPCYLYQLDYRCSVYKAKEQWRVKALMKNLSKAKDWVAYYEVKEKFVDLRATHASTIHKCQGSTYENVFIDLADIGQCNKPMEVARMLYVSITRASKQVILYGDLPDKYRGEIKPEIIEF